jgi:hypothetical protein
LRSIRHPLSGAVYDLREDGTIHVRARDEREGVFDAHGRWVSGELKHADPHLCIWIGGKELPNRFQQAADALRSTDTRDSQEVPS